MKNVMLASKVKPESVKFPVLASPKLDGVRCHIEKVGDSLVALSRSNKPIPNNEVQRLFQLPCYEGFDGELIYGEPTAPDVFRQTESAVMRQDDPRGKDVKLYVFDHMLYPDKSYALRKELLAELDRLAKGRLAHVVFVEQRIVTSLAELNAYEETLVNAGYEGVILRDPHAPYKFGRSTVKEGYLLKIKRFFDDEAVITGWEEKLINENEQKRDERGYAKRSTAKAGMVPAGTLGALNVEWRGHKFSIGSGFDDAIRDELWGKRDELPGMLVKFKYFPVGMKDGVPRFPVFLGLRAKEDVS